MPVLITNKKAHFDYQILEEFRAGLGLSSKMVKLIRARKIVLSGKFVVFQKDQLQILGLGVESYAENVPLLVTAKELSKIKEELSQKGLTCVVLNFHTSGRWLKAQIAVVKGKKNYDKRKTLKERDLDRENRREMAGQ
jgi:SsrA-binding protein